MSQSIAVTSDMVQERAGLVLASEREYITETSTGLVFDDDTPIEMWSALVERMVIFRGRVDFALADAINFGQRRYGEMYTAWVEKTGLQAKTLANVASVGRKVESSRRREDLDFTYHEAVAALPADDQDRLLGAAVENKWKRADLRAAVKEIRAESSGAVVTVPQSASPVPVAAVVVPVADRAEVLALIADLSAFIDSKVTTKVVTVDGVDTRHDRHCTATADRMVCAGKCEEARSLVSRAEAVQ